MNAMNASINFTLWFAGIMYPIVAPPVHELLITVAQMFIRTHEAISFSRFHALFSPTLMLHGVLSAVCVAALWEMTHYAFEVFYTRTTNMSLHHPQPYDFLAKGLDASSNPLVQQHALIELCRNVTLYPAWRVALFSQVTTQPSAWTSVYRPCMQAVKDLKAGLELDLPKPQGAATTVTATVADKKAPIVEPSVSAKLIKGVDILKPMASITLAQHAKGDAYDYYAKKEAHVRKVTLDAVEKSQSEVASAYKAFMGGFRAWLNGFYLIKQWNAILDRESLVSGLQDMERQLLAVQGITRLSAVSIREDAFGSVQHDLADIFNTLAACLTAAEARAVRNATVCKRFMIVPGGLITTQPPLVAVDVLKGSLYQLVKAFHQHLDSIPMDATARRIVDKVVQSTL
jgi:hypothetical protein